VDFQTEVRRGDDTGPTTIVPVPVPPPKPVEIKVSASDPPWLAVALGEIGVREIAGPKHNPRIIEYHACTDLRATDDETPWCSSQENWVFQQVGIAGTGSAQARSWEKWGDETKPRRGAVVVLKRGTKEWQGHVGTLLSWGDDYVELVSGNIDNGTRISRFPRSDVISMRWPKTVGSSSTIKVAGTEATLIVAEKLVDDPKIQKLIDMSGSVNTALAVAFMLGHLTCIGWIVYQRFLRMQSTGT